VTNLRTLRFGFLVGVADFGGIQDWRIWLFTWGTRVVSEAAAFALLGTLMDSPEVLRFLIIGNMISIGSASAFWAAAFFSADRWDGTYTLLVASPASIIPPIVGRTSVWMLNGVASSLLAFAVLGVIFDVHFPLREALLAVPVILLTIASAFAAAVLLGGLMSPWPQAQNLIRTSVTTLLMALSGVSVPIAFWPGPVEALAQILPLTHGLRAIRVLVDGGATATVLNETGLQLLVGIGWLVASTLLIDRIVNLGRASGSIDFVEG
jgi:ABC-2 type transport system permease protein